MKTAAGYRKFVRGCVDYHHQVDRYTQSSPTTPDLTPIHGLF